MPHTDPSATPAKPTPADCADLLKQLGELIRRARKDALGERRETFAERMGCSVVTLDKVESGAEGVGVGHVMSALVLIGAAAPVLEALQRSVDMLQLAQHPLHFPDN